MSSPEGHSLLMELRVARAWQVRPSELRKWSNRDRLSAAALLQHEDSIGPCGLSHTRTLGDLEGWFEVDDTVICWACARIDQYHKDHEDGPPPGALIRVIDTRTESEE